ncbi:MAG: 4-hydroxyphenylpyruvate dioxygenase [Actinomycetota bacterium]|nr:4-hydroxyphenylpyruvate dioxygenase [Actinomycetota bacterium]
MTERHDPFPILGFDYVQFFVGNAKQAAHFYRGMGFTPVAFMGLETGSRDRVSYAVRQGEVTFVFTGALQPDSPIADHVHRHGDGVHDVALRVPDAEEAFRVAVERGAQAVSEPEVFEDENGKIVRAAIATYGETIHSLVQRDNYSGTFFPGFKDLPGAGDTRPIASAIGHGVKGFGVKYVDHVVGNVQLGKMDEWVSFYEKVMGFVELKHFSDEDISTEYSALMSKVVWDGEGKIKLPINEPATGKRKSQIEEYLEYYGGPGVQHIALTSEDIVSTVESMRDAGIGFLQIPANYYDDAVKRVPEITDQVEALRRNGILVDKDEEGYLLQIFTHIAQDRPTVFYEVIERHGARGFGEGNFKALFEAIEREQAARGNL